MIDYMSNFDLKYLFIVIVFNIWRRGLGLK